jgi:hypothetical protein
MRPTWDWECNTSRGYSTFAHSLANGDDHANIGEDLHGTKPLEKVDYANLKSDINTRMAVPLVRS